MSTSKYFDNYLDLFQHPGWKQFVEEAEEVNGTLSYDSCKELREFLQVQAAKQQLAKIINFENLIRLSLEQSEESEAESDDPV